MITNKNEIIIGLSHTTKMSTRYQRGDKQWNQLVTLDFTGCTIGDLLDWATSERIIKFQNKIRSLESKSAFNAFMELGNKINIFAFDAHKNLYEHIERDELIEQLMNR